MHEESGDTQYVVLVNDEDQYSLWLKHRAVPQGWRATGKEGSKSECCQYVDEVWQDMRPKSLRNQSQNA